MPLLACLRSAPWARYSQTLAVPGVKSLLVVALFARAPVVSGAATLTLHVVQDLRVNYFAAGVVGAGFMLGVSAGAPVVRWAAMSQPIV